MLVILDIAALYVALGLVHEWRLGYWVREVDLRLGGVIVLTIFCLYVMSAYRLDRELSAALRTSIRAFVGVAVSGAIMASVIYVTKATDTSELFYRGNLPAALLLFAVWAAAVRYLASRIDRRMTRAPRWLVIGSGPTAELLRKGHRFTREAGNMEFLPQQNIDLARVQLDYSDGRIKVENSSKSVFSANISGILLATEETLPEPLIAQLMRLRLAGLPIMQFFDFYERYLWKVPVLELEDTWFAFAQGFSLLHHEVQLKVKRALDMLFAAIGLLAFLPLIVLIALVVHVTSRGPAFYNQLRCGYRSEPFRLHKFRTMVVGAETEGPQWSQPDDPRITRVGRFLRRTRLDELPQLWNVLVGEMSFIGPRPERPEFVAQLEHDIPYYDLRHLVKPGITGWAQVMFPYGASVDDAREKLEYDIYYIKNYSLGLDLYILFRTLRVVLSRGGR